MNRAATRGRPRLWLSRLLLKDIHAAFGGELRALLVGGAFTEPKTLEFFHELGIQIANGYGCTEACTAITVNDLRPFRPDTLGKPVAGMEMRIVNPGADGVGEVAVRSKTVMSHYLDDPELTAETIVDGWLMTGDLGKIDASGHLQLLGRKKNMIVTAEGKNIYPEDIENVFEGLPLKEFCVFAANYLWPQRSMTGEQLVLVARVDPVQNLNGAMRSELERCNQRLLPYKRVSGYILWDQDFPRTASLKIKRNILAEQIGRQTGSQRSAALVSNTFLAIVNPAAGGGRCGKMAKAALDKAAPGRSESAGGGDDRAGRRNTAGAGRVCRGAAAIHRGGRRWHGIRNRERPFPGSGDRRQASAGFFAAGHGKLVPSRFQQQRRGARAGSDSGAETHLSDVLCLKHAGGKIYFINLLSMGFTADVTAAANRRFKGLGELGYLLGVLLSLARLRRRAFPLRAEGETEFDRRRCLFLTFNNSKFTGGKMMIAPQASTGDGLIEYVRWGPIGRIGLLRNLPTLFDGTHIRHPLASRQGSRRIEFSLDEPVDVMIDGEVYTLKCESIEALPGVLDVLV